MKTKRIALLLCFLLSTACGKSQSQKALDAVEGSAWQLNLCRLQTQRFISYLATEYRDEIELSDRQIEARNRDYVEETCDPCFLNFKNAVAKARMLGVSDSQIIGARQSGEVFAERADNDFQQTEELLDEEPEPYPVALVCNNDRQ